MHMHRPVEHLRAAGPRTRVFLPAVGDEAAQPGVARRRDGWTLLVDSNRQHDLRQRATNWLIWTRDSSNRFGLYTTPTYGCDSNWGWSGQGRHAASAVHCSCDARPQTRAPPETCAAPATCAPQDVRLPRHVRLRRSLPETCALRDERRPRSAPLPFPTEMCTTIDARPLRLRPPETCAPETCATLGRRC
eukprot:251187-Chlamydomonas_euryale.AAC.1